MASEILLRSCNHARWLVDRLPAVARYHEFLGQTLAWRGAALYELNPLRDCDACFRQALDQLEPLARQSSVRPGVREKIARSWESIGAVLLVAGRLDEAEHAVVRSLGLRRKLQEDYPKYPPYWHALALTSALHGGVLARLGRYREAEAAFATALAYQEKIAYSAVGNPIRKEELAIIDGGLAWLRLRRPGVAINTPELLLRLQKAREMAPRGDRFRLTLSGLALCRHGEWDRALSLLHDADTDSPAVIEQHCWITDDHFMRTMAEHQEEVAPVVNAFCQALIYHRLGRTGEAVSCYQRGLHKTQSMRIPPGFWSVDVDTIRAEVEAQMGLRGSAPPPRPATSAEHHM